MIPIEKAKQIAHDCGYDQIIIIGRKVDTETENGHETVTTYGIDSKNCDVAANIGNFLKFKVMKWAEETKTEDQRSEHYKQSIRDFAEEVKSLCNDYSSMQGNVYILDVKNVIDSLVEIFLE